MIDLADDDESPDVDASLFHVPTILSVVDTDVFLPTA